MDLLKQCMEWDKNGEYKKIIDALENIPERGAELDLELAKAYIHHGDPATRQGRDMMEKAVSLMKRHEEFFKDYSSWNFRFGCAYFFLGREYEAVKYFRRAEELGIDEGAQKVVSRCEKQLAFPVFKESFRIKTENAWNMFARQEEEIRLALQNPAQREQVTDKIGDILDYVFEDIAFEVRGENLEGRCGLVISPEGNLTKLFMIMYFVSRMPRGLLRRWNVFTGIQSDVSMTLDIGGQRISGDDVQIWIDVEEEDSVCLCAYCEKLADIRKESRG